MQVQSFNNISDLINNLSLNISDVASGKITDNRVLVEKINHIRGVVENSLSLLGNSEDHKVIEFSGYVIKLIDVAKKGRFEPGFLNTIIQIASISLDKLKLINDQRNIELKIPVSFLRESIMNSKTACGINEYEIDIKAIFLEYSENQIIELAPWLTYINLTDGKIGDKIFKFTDEFINKLLQKANKVETLIIENSSIDGTAFKSIEKLDTLEKLIIRKCPNFNHSLPEMPKLKMLEIQECPNFKPFSHSINTQKTLLLNPEFFYECWSQLSDEEKGKTSLSLLCYDPSSYLDCWSKLSNEKIDKMVLSFYWINPTFSYDGWGERNDEEKKIVYQFLVQADTERFFNCWTLISDEEKRKISQSLSSEDVPKETRIEILYMLTPDMMVDTIKEFSSLEHKNWMMEPIFNGRGRELSYAIAILQELKAQSTVLTPEDLREFRGQISDVLIQIPFKTLAAIANIEHTTNLALFYLPYMHDSQVAVVVPQTSSKIFTDYLQNVPISKHNEILPYCTLWQKQYYLENDLAKPNELEEWVSRGKQEVDSCIKSFENTPNEKDYEQIKNNWSRTFLAKKIALQQYSSSLKFLSRVTYLFDYEKELVPSSISYIDSKKNQINTISNELDDVAKKIDSLAKLIEGVEEIPDEFIDCVTQEIMTDPYGDENGNNLDKSTWDQMKSNPFTRKSLAESVPTPNTELKSKIVDYNNRIKSLKRPVEENESNEGPVTKKQKRL